MEMMTSYFTMEPRLSVVEKDDCPGKMEEIVKLATPVWTETEVMEKIRGHVLLAFPEDFDLPTPDKYKTLWFPEKLLSSYVREIRSIFTFKSEYLDNADKVLRKIKTIQPDLESIFIGVHARRTDYQNYSKNVLGVKSPSSSYYREAMEYFLEEYQREGTRVWFVITSDSVSWVTKHLLTHSQTVWGGSDNPGMDMALLSRCNHSVISQGNFGSWSSFLAGGDIYTQYGPIIS